VSVAVAANRIENFCGTLQTPADKRPAGSITTRVDWLPPRMVCAFETDEGEHVEFRRWPLG
jgi:hypothetical protein